MYRLGVRDFKGPRGAKACGWVPLCTVTPGLSSNSVSVCSQGGQALAGWAPMLALWGGRLGGTYRDSSSEPRNAFPAPRMQAQPQDTSSSPQECPSVATALTLMPRRGGSHGLTGGALWLLESSSHLSAQGFFSPPTLQGHSLGALASAGLSQHSSLQVAKAFLASHLEDLLLGVTLPPGGNIWELQIHPGRPP